jgi:putative peptidoglycan lipid II flippase
MEKRKIIKSTLIITVLTAFNVLAGFFIQVVLAAKFGASRHIDAYLSGSTVPQLAIMVILGSLNIAFVPVLVEYITQKTKEDVSKIVNSFFNLSFLILVVLVVFGFLNASYIISIIVPGFKGEVYDLTVNIAKVIFPAVIFLGLTGVLSSIYYAHKKFTLPVIAPLINNLVILSCVVMFAGKLGIMSVAWGTFFGAVVQFILLLPILLPNYEFRVDLDNPGLRKTCKLITPLLIGAVFYKANNLIERFFASNFPEGTITCLGYAYKIMFVISMLATRGIHLSLFPVMSEYAAKRKIDELRKTFSLGIRTVLIILIPVMVVIGIFREQIIQVFFEREEFTHAATITTGFALLAYSGALFGLSICNILNFVFYAMQDTLTVVKVGVFGGFLNVILAYILSKKLGYIGLPLAYSSIVLLQTAILGVILKKRWKQVV